MSLCCKLLSIQAFLSQSGLKDRSGRRVWTSNPAKFKGCTPQRELLTEQTEEHSYIYAGSKLLREIITTTAEDGTETEQILDFRYDNAGLPYALIYQEGSAAAQTYYYITNLQGDVMYIVDESGDEVASYDYDPYGKLIYSTGSMAEINPLRYRGYYYDNDTDFYYVSSRYYDSSVCRFVNYDGYTSTGQGYIGHNMFAYCGNDPINRVDPSGYGFFGDLWNKITDVVDDACKWVADKVEQVSEFINNEDEMKVLNAKFIAFYKGKMVIKLPVGTDAASFGIIFMGNEIAADEAGIRTVRHEYGHTKQFDELGIIQFTTKVAIPSVQGYYLDKQGKMPYDYYSAPWEYQADQYGGVTGRPVPYEPWADIICQEYFYPGTWRQKGIRGRVSYLKSYEFTY